jgi:hypothetical protein
MSSRGSDFLSEILCVYPLPDGCGLQLSQRWPGAATVRKRIDAPDNPGPYFSTTTFARKFATPAVYLSSVTVIATASSSQS